MIEQTPILAGLAAFCAALLALLAYHAFVARPALARLGASLALHDEALGGGAGPAAQRIAEIERSAQLVRAEQERVGQRVSELEALALSDVSRIGFVRYDAFDDTGSQLSYALALLNREGAGVVISSIYSRTDTRTYGKAVQGFTPLANASEEEVQAISQARGARGEQ